MIDWSSVESHLLLNPRLPADQKKSIESIWQRISSRYPSHIALLTSGSSGSPKLVLLAKSALLAAADGANSHLVSGRSDTWLKTLPEFHVGGLSIYARSHLSGARVIEFEGEWNHQKVYDLAVREKVTLISLVPTQLFDFVQAKLPTPPSLRAVVVGGGALSNDLYLQARALSWPVLPSYGLTECGSQVATAQLDSIVTQKPQLMLLPHIEAKLNNEQKLMLRSDALFSAYVDLATGDVLDPKNDGWFTTEDRAQLNGRELKFLGRTQDFIKIGGESVDFSALEKKFDVLVRKRAFKGDIALVPVPDDRLGVFIGALASGMVEADRNELLNLFNSQVMPYERVRLTKEVAQIPRSELGKLLRSLAIKAFLGHSL